MPFCPFALCSSKQLYKTVPELLCIARSNYVSMPVGTMECDRVKPGVLEPSNWNNA